MVGNVTALNRQIAAASPYATNLSPDSASYPIGPWLRVSNLSNRFTNSLSEPARFFRLKK